MRIRQSTLGDADTCLRRMQYSIESPVYHGGSVRAVGTAVHAGHELYYGSRLEGPLGYTVQDIIHHAQQVFTDTVNMKPSHASEFTKQAGEFQWDDKVPDHDTGLVLVASILTAYHADPDIPWPLDWEVLGTEVPFELPLYGDHTRAGSIDLVLRDPAGNIVGVDHKHVSGNMWAYNKHHARKHPQPPFYVGALKELHPGAPGYRFFFDIMSFKGKFERREVTVTDEHIAAIHAKAVEVSTLYLGMRSAGLELPANPSSNLCSPLYCDAWSVCPYGAALDVEQ
jgi:hypothetical protein